MPLEAGSGTNPSRFPEALVGKASCKPSDRLRSSGLHILRHIHGCYDTRGPIKGHFKSSSACETSQNIPLLWPTQVSSRPSVLCPQQNQDGIQSLSTTFPVTETLIPLAFSSLEKALRFATAESRDSSVTSVTPPTTIREARPWQPSSHVAQPLVSVVLRETELIPGD